MIGIRSTAPTSIKSWLEGGEADPAGRKDALFLSDRRGLVWAETEGSRPGQAEVLEMVEATLGPAPVAADLPPLYAAARRTPDDLCLMEKRDGEWHWIEPRPEDHADLARWD